MMMGQSGGININVAIWKAAPARCSTGFELLAM
jgi:hypothetical protein